MLDPKFRAQNFGGIWFYSSKEGLSRFFELLDPKHSSQVLMKSTLGQFTTVTDKNGVDIYADDILQVPSRFFQGNEIKGDTYLVTYGSGPTGTGWYFKRIGIQGSHGLHQNLAERWTIIGNSHDNPELLTNES